MNAPSRAGRAAAVAAALALVLDSAALVLMAAVLLATATIVAWVRLAGRVADDERPARRIRRAPRAHRPASRPVNVRR